MKEPIKNFYPEGENYFLSNFYPSEFDFMGHHFLSNEHFYQSAKATNEEDFLKILNCPTAAATKKVGRKIKIRNDWEKIKNVVMFLGLKLKFNSNPELKAQLLATEDAILEEGNWWGDTWFGINEKTGEGKNYLGRLLMKLREEYQKEKINE